MPLCRLCRSIDFSAFLISLRRTSPLISHHQGFPSDHNLFYYYDDDQLPLWSVADSCTSHYGDIEALRNNSATCDLYRLIEGCVNDTLVQFQSANKQGFRYPLSGHRLFLFPRSEADGFQILGDRVNESGAPYRHFDVLGGIGLCVDEGSPLASTVRGRTVPASPTCPAALRRIKSWMAGSEARHRFDQLGNAKPTRIIEIKSGGSEISVRPSGGVTGDYAALSHCWGSAQPATLNKNTVATLRTGVKTNTLPQSFQDAVWLACELGIRYLWIDSLCILQDDSEDWARESARMDEVYGHAVLTISASRAASSEEGFLSDRPQQSYVSVPLRTNSHSGDMLAFALPREYAGDTQGCARLDDEPLTSRGWALQERYLSWRTLHFGHRQTFFESATHFEAEDLCSVKRNLWRACRTPRHFPRSDQWERVVEEFSRRKLTISGDKLPALAGLAKYFAATAASRPGDSKADSLAPVTGYLAGLRWDTIIEDLSWSLHVHASKGERPDRYRAPSWTWASMDGAIQYRYGASPGRMTHLAIARDASVYLESADSPFGKVTGGWLYLQGLRIVANQPKEKDPGGGFWCMEGDVSFTVYAVWDAEPYRRFRNRFETVVDPTRAEVALWLIPLWWDGGQEKSFEVFFLIVEATDHQVSMHKDIPGFRRVGCGAVHGERLGLRGLMERWTVAKEKKELEGMLIL